MFNPIEAPDSHRGPATGDTSEHGTTWKDAAARINAAFAELFDRAKAEVEPETGVTAEFVAYLNARFEAAEAEVVELKARAGRGEAVFMDLMHEALVKVQALEATITALSTPATPPEVDEPEQTEQKPEVAPADPVETAPVV